mgnify:CR=1 FL=1
MGDKLDNKDVGSWVYFEFSLRVIVAEMKMFKGYIGIDYSGAETPTSSLKGLRVYVTDRETSSVEVEPPPSPRKYWTRRGLAEWLVEVISGPTTSLIGIDHAFSFPIRYFMKYKLPLEWPSFLDDFHEHWPTDGDHMYVDFVRDGTKGDWKARAGDTRWRRLTEERAGGAKSVFHFDVPGSVAKSTHAGLPWLRYLRQELKDRVFFWPFDGWDIPSGKSVIVEVYPSLWSRNYKRQGRTADQHDAFSVASWLRDTDRAGNLNEFFKPGLTDQEQKVASIEGWILGVM